MEQKQTKLMRSRAVGIDKQQKGFVSCTAFLKFFRFVVEHFESVYQLRMRVYLCTNLGVHKDQL
jgi:hypothetical protein